MENRNRRARAIHRLGFRNAARAGPVRQGARFLPTRHPSEFRILLTDRRFEFDVERAIFLTVLHRLFAPGSDRACDRWRLEYAIPGVEGIALHHVYRAMAFLGEALDDQAGATPFGPRCVKDLVEEDLFARHRDLFSGLDLVFFDTTHPLLGAVLDDQGRPISCEMWPGNTADVQTLLPVVERLRKRFRIGRFCIVADRGMIAAKTIEALEDPECDIPYILGARMRRVKEVSQEVLSRAGRYREVHPEGCKAKDPSPLMVKEVRVDGRRYIVCRNPRQARKDAATRQAIIADLEERVGRGPKRLIGNRGYARYLTMVKGAVALDREKIEESPGSTASGCFGPTWTLPPKRSPCGTRSSGGWNGSSGR